MVLNESTVYFLQFNSLDIFGLECQRWCWLVVQYVEKLVWAGGEIVGGKGNAVQENGIAVAYMYCK